MKAWDDLYEKFEPRVSMNVLQSLARKVGSWCKTKGGSKKEGVLTSLQHPSLFTIDWYISLKIMRS